MNGSVRGREGTDPDQEEDHVGSTATGDEGEFGSVWIREVDECRHDERRGTTRAWRKVARRRKDSHHCARWRREGKMGTRSERQGASGEAREGWSEATDPARGNAVDETKACRKVQQSEPSSVAASKTQQKPVLRRKSSVTEIPGVYLADSNGTEGTRRTVSFGDQMGKELEEVFEIDARKGVFHQLFEDVCTECINLCSKWKASLLGRRRSQHRPNGHASKGKAEERTGDHPPLTPRTFQ